MTVIDLEAYRREHAPEDILPATVYTVADWLSTWPPRALNIRDVTYHRVLVHGDVRLRELAAACHHAGLELGSTADGLTITPKGPRR